MNSKQKKSTVQPVQPPPPQAVSTDDPFIGKTVGHCTVVEKIAEGGTADVYKGYNTTFELERVLKILKPSLKDEEEFFLRFKQEAQLTARLDHPNILRVYDTGETHGHFFIEMEYVNGLSLRDYIQRNVKLNEKEILTIALQIARALEYAHGAEIRAPDNEVIHGILHRDIKPENIMITPAGTVKLMDFGAAKPLNLTSNTMQGMIVGTFHYMSPEQLNGDELDIRSDFFSLGIVLYEVCTGRRPFIADKLTELIEKISKCSYTPVQKIRPSITPRTAEVIEKMLSRKRTHRPASAKEIAESLQICIQTLSAWSLGRKAVVPFSWKRAFPALSMIFSTVALVLSFASFTLYFRRPAPSADVAYNKLTRAAPSLLEKGKHFENNDQWYDAVNMYELVPSIEEGGPPNEYLEARIRTAYIGFTHLRQLTKAKSILEKLRGEFSDPAIDAYLGLIYHRQAQYLEASERFTAALSSQKASVIPQTEEFQRTILYHNADALDRHYTYVAQDRNSLMEAIEAWNFFKEFSSCPSRTGDKQCEEAARRLQELRRHIDEN